MRADASEPPPIQICKEGRIDRERERQVGRERERGRLAADQMAPEVGTDARDRDRVVPSRPLDRSNRARPLFRF